MLSAPGSPTRSDQLRGVRAARGKMSNRLPPGRTREQKQLPPHPNVTAVSRTTADLSSCSFPNGVQRAFAPKPLASGPPAPPPLPPPPRPPPPPPPPPPAHATNP